MAANTGNQEAILMDDRSWLAQLREQLRQTLG
jgi:hypothetical protein